MPALNFDYGNTQPRAIKGAVADMRANVMRSLINEDVTLTGFGVPVFQGTANKGATKTGSAKFLGVTTIDRAVYTDEMLTQEGFRQHDSMLVMEVGVIWVEASVAVAAGDTAYVTSAGAFTNVATSNIAVGNFETVTTGAGQLTKLRLK